MHVGHAEQRLLAPQPVLAVYPHGVQTATGLTINHANAILGRHELQVSFIETRAGGDVRKHPVESLRDGAPAQLVAMVTSWVAIVVNVHEPVPFGGKLQFKASKISVPLEREHRTPQ